MHRDVEEFIERLGVLWQRDGLPRIAGRIFGLALVSPDPCSLDDIAESLGVSKASVSNDARMLEQMGFIERVSIAGDRKDYYQVNEGSLERALELRVQRIEEFRKLLESGMELPIRNPSVRERLADHRVAFGYLSNALSEALKDIKERHTAPRSRKS
ncbi:MAG TPA: MarR family transcriptional regulator [Gemmatimonadaceae bacterium]|nr:MarR family transcriptional regulator [Gemmatimonadaceae bacterium]